MTRVFIDADACPVRAETLKVAARHKLEVFVVSNGGIRPDPDPNVRTVVVAPEADAADIWIAERIGPGDVCVTSDIPLAAKCLEAGALALRPDGEAFTPSNIGHQLAMRDLMSNPRNSVQVVQAVISMLAGDVYFNRSVRRRLLFFKAIYNISRAIHWREDLAYRRMRLASIKAANQAGM